MSSFATYLLGFIILIIGLAIAAYLLNVPSMWIIVGVIVLLGIGVLMATSRTKMRDPQVPPPPPPGPPRSGGTGGSNYP
jgi:positive regulator of sigma E activity